MEKMSFAAFKSAALEKLVVLKSLLTLGWGTAVKKATEVRPEDVEKARAAAEATKEKAAEIKSKLDGKVPPVAWKIAGVFLVVLCAWFLLDALLLFAVLFGVYVLIGLFLQGKNRPLPVSADKIVLPSILIGSLAAGWFIGGSTSGPVSFAGYTLGDVVSEAPGDAAIMIGQNWYDAPHKSAYPDYTKTILYINPNTHKIGGIGILTGSGVSEFEPAAFKMIETLSDEVGAKFTREQLRTWRWQISDKKEMRMAAVVWPMVGNVMCVTLLDASLM